MAKPERIGCGTWAFVALVCGFIGLVALAIVGNEHRLATQKQAAPPEPVERFIMPSGEVLEPATHKPLEARDFPPPIDTMRIPRDTRMIIYAELWRIRHRVMRQADALYPLSGPGADDDKRGDLIERLRGKWEGELAEQFKITTEQLGSIDFEGYRKAWPTPKRR